MNYLFTELKSYSYRTKVIEKSSKWRCFMFNLAVAFKNFPKCLLRKGLFGINFFIKKKKEYFSYYVLPLQMFSNYCWLFGK